MLFQLRQVEEQLRVNALLEGVRTDSVSVLVERLSILEYARYQAVCVLAILYGAGLRRGELERLDVADWDRDASVLRIDGQKTGVERSVPVGEGVWRCIEGTCRIGTIGSKPPGTWNCRTTTPTGFTACG